MSTQEEKKMNEEELNTVNEETVETPENNDSVDNTEEQEPLSETDQLKLQLAEAEAKIAERMNQLWGDKYK